ncbi:MAG: DUF86 domain-containing protein [Proteobacteria bacterium]|nr:DUF86 domain-containing protein [Pseudomonadota bacterium]
MRRDPRAYLWDARESAELILTFTRERTLEHYLADPMLRAAVERQFEIIGEALNQLAKVAPAIAQRIPDIADIVAFRNRLIHAYITINHKEVWGTVQKDVKRLHDHLDQLLGELGKAP